MKIGDRVRINKNFILHNKKIKPNQTGTIVGFYEIKLLTLVGVEFDENIKGHDCNGLGEKGHCSWLSRKYLVVEE